MKRTGRAIPLGMLLHGNANGYVRDPGTPGALNVDLHWGLASRYFLFPMEAAELWERLEPVTLENGLTVDTFSPEDTLLFLCMHATKDTWANLSLVCDLAELLRAHPDMNLESVLQKADSIRSGRMVLLGLYLAHHLLEAPLPDRIRNRIDTYDGLAPLADRTMILLFESPRGIRRLWHAIRFHLQVRDPWTDGRGAALHQIRLALQPTAEDRAWIHLPPRLQFLYVVIRPVRKLIEHVYGPSESQNIGTLSHH